MRYSPAKKLKRALLRLEAGRTKTTDGRLASRVLALRNDATLLCLHEVGTLEPAGCVLGRPVEDLGLRADRRRLRRPLLERHAVRLALREETAAHVTETAAATHWQGHITIAIHLVSVATTRGTRGRGNPEKA